jgi:hypothetical protein
MRARYHTFVSEASTVTLLVWSVPARPETADRRQKSPVIGVERKTYPCSEVHRACPLSCPHPARRTGSGYSRAAVMGAYRPLSCAESGIHVLVSETPVAEAGSHGLHMRSHAMSLGDLDDLVASCRTADARAYVSEAVACYRAGAYRSCIVAVWIATVYDLLDKLMDLALGGDAEAKRITDQLTRSTTRSRARQPASDQASS